MHGMGVLPPRLFGFVHLVLLQPFPSPTTYPHLPTTIHFTFTFYGILYACYLHASMTYSAYLLHHATSISWTSQNILYTMPMLTVDTPLPACAIPQHFTWHASTLLRAMLFSCEQAFWDFLHMVRSLLQLHTTGGGGLGRDGIEPPFLLLASCNVLSLFSTTSPPTTPATTTTLPPPLPHAFPPPDLPALVLFLFCSLSLWCRKHVPWCITSSAGALL